MQDDIRVFVVDDDEVFGNILCKMLHDLHIEVFYYKNPIQALEEIEVVRPDFIFLDYLMPEITADQFMIKFSEKAMFEDRRIIMVTSSTVDDESLVGLKLLGIEQVIEKPVTFEILKEILEKDV